MSTDEPRPDERDDDDRAERKQPDDEPIEAFDPSDADDQPQITLDRYLSKRRPAPRMGWMQIISLVAMLGALIMILMYKESCGRQISQLMGAMSEPAKGGKGQPAARRKLPGVPVRLAPVPASRPASKPATKPAAPPTSTPAS